MNLIWKPIKDYEDLYEVSNHGNVRSKDRIVAAPYPLYDLCRVKPLRGKEKGQVIVNGYYKVCFCKEGKRMNYSVHRLVALTFIPNPENKPTVNHIDGNKLNNHVSNLEWATQQEQVIHSIVYGLRNEAKGSQLPHSKLTVDDVIEIKTLLANGKRPIDIHKMGKFNCGYGNFLDIKAGRNWKHIKI